MNTKPFEHARCFGKDKGCTLHSCLHRVHLVQVIADDVVHIFRGLLFCLFSFPRMLRCLRHLELPRARRRHARQRDNREFKHLAASDISPLTSVESCTDRTQRSVDDTHLQRSRSTHLGIDRASFSPSAKRRSEPFLCQQSSMSITITDQQRQKSASSLLRESSSISARRSVSEGKP